MCLKKSNILTGFLIICFLGGIFPAQGASITSNFTPLTSTAKSEPILCGITLDAADPFKMHFNISNQGKPLPREEASVFIEYFLSALTMPEGELWVNLSPSEPGRIISDTLIKTKLGEGMLRQDYILKQISAGLTNPSLPQGKQYWADSKSQKADLGRVWIISNGAKVYEDGLSAYVEGANFKVSSQDNNPAFNEFILPLVEKEVNNGTQFAQLRQIYNAYVLAVWFKKRVKESIFQYYIDEKKVSGIDNADAQTKEKIYLQYLEAFKNGAYNSVEKKRFNNKNIFRKYFCGGVALNEQGIKIEPGKPTSKGDTGVDAEFQPRPPLKALKRVGLERPEISEGCISFYLNIARDPKYRPIPVDLGDKIGEFSVKMIPADPNFPMPGNIPSFSLTDGKNLIVVMRDDIALDDDAREESVIHEVLEYWLIPQVKKIVAARHEDLDDDDITDVAHALAWGYYIINFFDGKDLSAISKNEIARLTEYRAKKVLEEERGYYDRWLLRFFGNKLSEKIKTYEALFKRKVSESTPIAAVKIDAVKYNTNSDTATEKKNSAKYLHEFADKFILFIYKNYHETRELDYEYNRRNRDDFVYAAICDHLGEEFTDAQASDYFRHVYDSLLKHDDIDIAQLSGEGLVKLLSEIGILNYISEYGSSGDNKPHFYAYKRINSFKHPQLSTGFLNFYSNLTVRYYERVREKTIKGSQLRFIELVESPNHRIPDGAPAVSFSYRDTLVIVKKGYLSTNPAQGKRLSENEEAVLHELLEAYYTAKLKPSDDRQRIAHVLSTAELISEYGDDGLLPIHKAQIDRMSTDGLKRIQDEGEDRRINHDQWIRQYLGDSIADKVSAYNNYVFLQAVDEKLAVINEKKLGGVAIDANNVIFSGNAIHVKLSAQDIASLRDSDGMSFTITSAVLNNSH